MTTISRSKLGLSLARPIGKVRQKPLKLKSVGIAPGMKSGGSPRGWGLSRQTNKPKTY